MPFTIVRKDLVKMQADAIVNAANTELRMGGGVCGAIFKAAGKREMQDACQKLAPISVGAAVLTPGFALPAKYVIHAAGPVYDPHRKEACAAELRSAYLESLRLAREAGCESIAFPLISSGIYGYPKEEAFEVASRAILDFLAQQAEGDMEVTLAVFDSAAVRVSETLWGEVKRSIDDHYVSAPLGRRENLLRVERKAVAKEKVQFDADASPTLLAAAPAPAREAGIDDLIGRLDEPFSVMLLKLIDAKGRTDVEIYKRANIDRKLFSKIRTGKGYTPKKATILALAVALELNLLETEELLERAGYALSHASKFDVIVEYFIVHRRYNIYEINEVLFRYDLPLLGC